MQDCSNSNELAIVLLQLSHRYNVKSNLKIKDLSEIILNTNLHQYQVFSSNNTKGSGSGCMDSLENIFKWLDGYHRDEAMYISLIGFQWTNT